MRRRTALRMGALAVCIAAFAAAWAVFAPPELGGSMRYVVTQGSSMEPKLHAGDLALVRADADPAKGDIALYEHPRLQVHVLHRIVGASGGHYVLKGDNNDFLDDVRPSAEEIHGELWVAFPRVGSALLWAREPLHAALIVFGLSFVALGGVAAVRRRPAPRRSASVRAVDAAGADSGGSTAQVVLAIGLAGIAVFALLAVVSRTRPALRAQSVPDAYAHVGSFSYGASVEPSDVYPDGRVESGEAVFVSLVPALDVEFAYRLEAEDASGVRGSTTLGAVLADGAGWERDIPLARPKVFSGSAARATGVLDVGSLTDVVAEMKALTGSGTSTFALDITADVSVRGNVGGGRIRRSFVSRLPLVLDTVSLRPDLADGASLTVKKAEAATVLAPASLSLGGMRLSVEEARTLSIVGLLLAAIVAGIGVAAFWRRTGGEPSQIASVFGDRLITISQPPSDGAARATELRDAESLCRLAELHDRIVLHWREGRDHVYQVEDGRSVYQYRVAFGVEAGSAPVGEDEDTGILRPTTLPSRAAAG